MVTETAGDWGFRDVPLVFANFLPEWFSDDEGNLIVLSVFLFFKIGEVGDQFVVNAGIILGRVEGAGYIFG